MAKKIIYCADCEKETIHTLDIQGASNDIALICSECGHVTKFPRVSPEELTALIAEHKEANDRPIDRTPLLSDVEKEEALSEYADDIQE
jgi:uncharacterized Zn finger protein